MLHTEKTALKKAAFLDALSKGLTVTRALQLSTLVRSTAYQMKNEDPGFAEAWAEAELAGTDYLIDEARRRAVEGTRRPLVHAGRVVTRAVYDERTGFETLEELWLRDYSDVLLCMLLKARDPEKFDDSVRRAKLERKWAEEDGKTDNSLVPAAAVLTLIEELGRQKAAKADHGA